MLKVASLIWIMLGTVLAGAAVLVVLATPSLAPDGLRLVPIAAVCGFVAAIPLSVLIAKQIGAK